ncbi:MAG: hypothetical protein WD512_16820 [Candidatus Paceibacterota bacterium]
MTAKPPLGLPPKFTYIKPRTLAIQRAINRYMSEDMEVPVEWITEYNSLIELKK